MKRRWWVAVIAMFAASAPVSGPVFTDVTAQAGIRFVHNAGRSGKFQDVTKAAGIQNASFGTSAAWLDYDRDGKLDLFVANYVQWTPANDLWCSLDGASKSYCTPESYKGTRARLFHNLGGRFED